MQKNCPKCGAPLPEESSFCLNCFSYIDNQAVVTTEAPVEATPKAKKAKPIKKALPAISPKVLRACGICALVSLTFVVSIFVAFSSPNNEIPVALNNSNTESVASDGIVEGVGGSENPTNASEEETQKATIFDKLFGKDKNKAEEGNASNNESSAEETTEKQGFFEKLFGDKDKNEEKESNSNSKSTTTTQASAQATTAQAPQPSTTEKPASKPEITTKKPAETTTSAPTYSSASDFEYTANNNGGLTITKYTGNASIVHVPATIDGSNVNSIGENTFKDNSSIKEIIFDTSDSVKFILPTYAILFNNLPNLTKIVLPAKATDNSFNFAHYFNNLPSLSSVEVKNGKGEYLMSVDGVVYSSNGMALDYYPPNKAGSNYTPIDSCTCIRKEAVLHNKHLKNFTFNTAFQVVNLPNFYGCDNLSAFVSNSTANPKLFVIDGVLFQNNQTTSTAYYQKETFCTIIYPAGKTNTRFESPSGYKFDITNYTFCKNPYLTELCFNGDAYISSNALTGNGYTPPNITKVRVMDTPTARSNYYPAKITVEYY